MTDTEQVDYSQPFVSRACVKCSRSFDIGRGASNNKRQRCYDCYPAQSRPEPAPPASELRVEWTAERETRGASPTITTSRCPARGCPIRYPGGPSRPCPDHDGSDDEELALAPLPVLQVPGAPVLTPAQRRARAQRLAAANAQLMDARGVTGFTPRGPDRAPRRAGPAGGYLRSLRSGPAVPSPAAAGAAAITPQLAITPQTAPAVITPETASASASVTAAVLAVQPVLPLCVPGCPACLLMLGRATVSRPRSASASPPRGQRQPVAPLRHACLAHLDPAWGPGPRLTAAGAAAWLELLRDPARTDVAIAALAGCGKSLVGLHRRRLEALGAIPPWRGPTSDGQLSAASAAARDELLRDASRTNADIARLCGCSDVMVGLHRRKLGL